MLEKIKNYNWKRRMNRLKRSRIPRKRKYFITRRKYNTLRNDNWKYVQQTYNRELIIFVMGLVIFILLVFIHAFTNAHINVYILQSILERVINIAY